MLALFGLALAASLATEQARIFAKRGYWEEALGEVERGLAEASVADALDLYQIGVDAAFEVGDIDRVIVWSKQASDLAMDPAVSEQWLARASITAASWGWVRSEAPVTITYVSGFLDPDQRRVAERASGKRGRVALPVGVWLVNGLQVTVAAGEEVALETPTRPFRVGVGVVGTAFLGPEVQGLLPPVGVHLGLEGRLGAVQGSASAQWTPQFYISETGQSYTSPFGGAAGVGLGGVVEPVDKLEVYGRVGVEGRVVQGLKLDCQTGCGQARGVVLYVPGWTVGPTAEVGLWLGAERALGLALWGGVGWGRLVSGGQADVQGTMVRWDADAPGIWVGALGLKLQGGWGL